MFDWTVSHIFPLLLSQLRHPEPCEATAKDLISTRFFGPLGLRMTKSISCLQQRLSTGLCCPNWTRIIFLYDLNALMTHTQLAESPEATRAASDSLTSCQELLRAPPLSRRLAK